MPAQVPEFDQIVQFVVENDTPGGEPIVHFVPPHQLSLDTVIVLSALKEGYERAAARGHVLALQADEIETLRGAASEVYHPDVVEHEVVSSNPAEVVTSLLAVRSRPEWHVGLQCEAADLGRTKGVYFNPADGSLYVCIQPHKAQADWRPDLPGQAALWLRFYAPEAGPQPWVQPYGGSGTYTEGAIVTHNGFTWRNVHVGQLNVWEPGVFGWEKVAG